MECTEWKQSTPVDQIKDSSRHLKKIGLNAEAMATKMRTEVNNIFSSQKFRQKLTGSLHAILPLKPSPYTTFMDYISILYIQTLSNETHESLFYEGRV